MMTGHDLGSTPAMDDRGTVRIVDIYQLHDGNQRENDMKRKKLVAESPGCMRLFVSPDSTEFQGEQGKIVFELVFPVRVLNGLDYLIEFGRIFRLLSRHDFDEIGEIHHR